MPTPTSDVPVAVEPVLADVDVVSRLTGLTPWVIHSLTRKGLFPQPIRFSRRNYRWHLGEVREYIEAKLAEKGGIANAS